ncbi:MAG: DUF1559 domain-containing protein [Planctomycetaceae bacterium]|nr:DUF1559 domain-containing protein [Planctomycetaceae bacterium]
MDQETTKTGHEQRTPFQVVFWLATWLGTILAGGVFGVVNAGPLGLPFGFVFAGMFGVPVLAVAATLTWCFWLSRYRVVMATVAGSATGIVSTIIMFGDVPFDFHVSLAGILGALGGGIGGGLHWRHTRGVVASAEENEPWQFTMREMFSHVTVFAVLLAVFSCVGVAVRSGREEGRRATCENNLQTLALALGGYQSSYGRLPPAVVVNENLVPVLSWRVRVADVIYYGYYGADFSANMDFSKPWNDPANAPFLSQVGVGHFHCPSIGRDRTVNTTHYVAVTGPGTYWTEVGRIDEDAPQEAILAIGWPPSDIHWAEPRDVSPDEFVAWFQSESPPPRRVHPGGLHYINGRGAVCTLPWDTEAGELRRMLKPRAE